MKQIFKQILVGVMLMASSMTAFAVCSKAGHFVGFPDIVKGELATPEQMAANRGEVQAYLDRMSHIANCESWLLRAELALKNANVVAERFNTELKAYRTVQLARLERRELFQAAQR